MDFMEAIQSVFKNYASIKGRAPRSEYWFFFMFYIIVSLVAAIVDQLLTGGIIYVLVALGMILPCFCVTIRRLHDVNRSGWWIFIMLVPLVGPLLLLYWYCKKGTDGPNDFGDDPLSVGTPQF